MFVQPEAGVLIEQLIRPPAVAFIPVRSQSKKRIIMILTVANRRYYTECKTKRTCGKASGRGTAKLECQTSKTNQPLADDSTGNASVKKPLLLLKVSIFMGRL